MSQPNHRPLSHIQKALHEQIPGEREREIYREVAIHGRLPAQIAARFEMSEARVRGIVHRVRRWLAQVHLPVDLRGVQAMHLHRLEHQWQEAMSAWYRSGSKEETVKASYEDLRKKPAGRAKSPAANVAKTASGKVKPDEDGKRKVERTTRAPCGDVRYLEQARKIMAEYRSLSAEVAAAQQKEQRDAEKDSPKNSSARQEQRAAGAIAAVRERQRKKSD